MTACASHPANSTAAIVVSRRRFTVRISRPKRLAGGWLIFKLSQPSTRNPVGRAAPAKTSDTSLAVWPPVRAWDTSGSADHWGRVVSSRRELCGASPACIFKPCFALCANPQTRLRSYMPGNVFGGAAIAGSNLPVSDFIKATMSETSSFDNSRPS